MKTIPPKTVVAMVLAVVALGIIVARFWPKPSLEQFAKGAMSDFVEGRANSLYAKFSESEMQELGIDEYRFGKILDKLREEVKAGKVGIVNTHRDPVGVVTVAADVSPGSGQSKTVTNWAVSFIAFDTGQGFRVGGFESLVTWYYHRQLPVDNAKLRGNPAMAVSVLKGLQRDREFWISMGVKGFPGVQPGMFRTWPKYAEDKYKLLKYKGVNPKEVGLPEDWRQLNL